MQFGSSEFDRILADEPRLIELSQQGDRQAFAVLVEHYWNRLYRWLYHLCHHRQAAEDLTQDALMKALAAIDSFKPGSNFQAWLFRIAFNNFLNKRRSEGRARQRFPNQLPVVQRGPIDHMMSEEALKALARALGRLPQDFRAALLLRVEQEMPFRDIGSVLGVTEETARWRVFKARQKLMDVLATQLDREKS